VLMNLAEDSGRDLRSCLNSLQFMRTRGMKRLSKATYEQMPVAKKDDTKSFFDIWDALFFSRPKKSQLRENQKAAESSFEKHYNLVIQGGDTQKVIDGIFENMLNAKYADPTMSKTSFCSDWLQFADVLSCHSRRSQDWGLMRYLPCMGVAAHMSCVTPNLGQLEMPSSQGNCRRAAENNRNIVDMFMLGLSAEARVGVTPSNVVLDLLSPLEKIMNPIIKPGSLLASDEEKQMVANLVDTMLHMGLTWKMQQNESYRYTYVLEPAVHTVVSFDEFKSTEAACFSDKHKQMLAHEVELERMRRMEKARHGDAPPSAEDTPKKNSDGTVRPKLQRTVSQLYNKTPDSVVVPKDQGSAKKHVSVMGYVQRAEAKEGDPVKVEREQHPVFFRFQEGFSAAVRRTVYVSDFASGR